MNCVLLCEILRDKGISVYRISRIEAIWSSILYFKLKQILS